MALNATTNWYIRAGGSNNNGGGYDSAISGAGTNYADADAAILALTDWVSVGTTALTTVTGGCTAAMIGNVIKMRSWSSGGSTGYRVITAVPDGNTLTLDAAYTAGTGGSGNIGGASATILNFTSGGTLGTPAVTSPLAAGHTVNVRGAGTDDPSSADYTHTGGYAQFIAGDVTSGRIKWVGYNGRPRFNCDGLLFYLMNAHHFTNFKFVAQSTTNGTLGMINSTVMGAAIYNCYFDQNGYDVVGTISHAVNKCWFKNGGATTTSGTNQAIRGIQYGAEFYGNFIDAWRGGGIDLATPSNISSVIFNVIANIKSSSKPGIEYSSPSNDYITVIANNTVYGCASDGIKLTNVYAILISCIVNNILSNNTGYGLNCAVGSTALNDRTKNLIDYNNFYLNTTGARNAVSAGSNDLALDPTFTNAAGGDYSIGTNLKALAYPGAFPGGTSTGYLDMGAVQRQESSSSLPIIKSKYNEGFN